MNWHRARRLVHMRRMANRVIGWSSAIGFPLLLLTGVMIQREAESNVIVEPPPPFSQRMGCSSWRPGLSRTVTIHAIEDEHGNLTRIECHRYRERGARTAL